MIGRYSRAGLVLFGVTLYGGPLLAGLAGHRAAVLPVFALLFLLHVSATRKPDLNTRAGWAGLAMMAAMQVLLVTLAWGVGLFVSSLIGPIALPVWAPIVLTAIAAGFGAWAYRDAAEMDVMLDSAIEAIERLDAEGKLVDRFEWLDPQPEVTDALDTLLETLRGHNTWNASLVDPLVQDLEAAVGPNAFDAFYDAAGRDGDDNEPIVDYALLRYVASREVFAQLIDRGEAGLAPQLMLDAPDDRVREEARTRLVDLAQAVTPVDQMPDAEWVASLAERYPNEGYEITAALCRRE